MNKMKVKKCDFCEHHRPESPFCGPCVNCCEGWTHRSLTCFKLKTRMSDKQQSLWIGYCLSQGFKDGIEQTERKKEMETNEKIMLDYENAIRMSDGKAVLEVGGKRIPVRLDNLTVRCDCEVRSIEFEGDVLLPDEEFEFEEYCRHDAEITKRVLNNLYGLGITRRSGKYPWGQSVPEIKKVIFNDPATIVIWADGTKTVVKTQCNDMGDYEVYDPEKGLAMAITKKALGNKRDYYHTVKHWVKKYDKQTKEQTAFEKFAEELREFGKKSLKGDS